MKKRIHILILLLTITIGSIFGQSADFTTSLTNNENCGGTIVTFSINDTTGVSTYKWEFGNGQPDKTGTISPTDDGTSSTSYVEAGDFTAQLTVNDTIQTVQTIHIHAIPTPDFTIVNGTEENCINATADVDFQYTGTVPAFGADIVSWSWNFGDGTGEHVQTSGGDVTYTYSSYGDYTVIIEVTDANGCVNNAFKADAVKLHSTPKADFTFDFPTNCNIPITVDFTDASTDDQSSITNYEWTFTDVATGSVLGTSTEQNPSFDFTSEGEYYATLKVITSSGCVDEMTQTLNFSSNTVSFTPNTQQTICAGESVDFTNTSVDGSGTPSSFYWEFGDGENSTDENPSHIYNSASGSPYSVTLTVTFANGCVGSYTADDLVIVTSLEGLDISVDKDVSCKNYTVNATAGLGAVLYQWDFDFDGTTPDFDVSGISNTASYNYTAEGVYHIYLRAINTSGCNAESVYDSIVVEYPKADFDVISGQYGCFLQTANFDASASSNQYPDGFNAITNYEWDFQNNGTIDYSDASPTASHTYSQQGNFDVKLIITTEDNCTDTVVKTDVVERGLPPTANFTFDQANLCVNTPVNFTNTSLPNPLFPSNQIDSLIWDFGDGTILSGNPLVDATLNTPSHIYTDDTQDDGTPFTVTLTTFIYGCNSSTHTEQVDIDYPIARFIPSQDADCDGGGQLIQFEALDADNLSEGVDEYRWDFGDGTLYPGPTANDYATGNDPTISYTFTTNGHYPVKLFVKNNTSTCEDNEVHMITVETGSVNFETNDTVICRDVDEVHFTNLSVASEPDVVYHWDFGVDAVPATFDGATPPPVHYTSNGEKTVVLSSNNTHTFCGHIKTRTNYISVRGPVADFDWTSENADNNVVCKDPNEHATFTSTTTSTPNPNPNVSYEWHFGADANPFTATRNNEDPIDVSYSDFGTKSITLKVTDSKGCIDEITKNDIITVPKLIAYFNIDGLIYCTGNDISFNDQSQNLSGYGISDWAWDFGTDANPASATDQNPANVTYSSKGTKTVSLTITNNKGCTDTYIKDFQMYEANASFTNATDVGCAPASVQFTNTSEDISSSYWEFGDPFSSPQSVTSPSNIYIYPGKYDVTLITTSIGGCKDTLVKPADVFVDGSYFDSLTYVIDQPCLNSPTNPEVTYTIHGMVDTKYVVFDFGDGTPAYNYTVPDILNPPTTLDITHTYSTIGTFTPKLTLQDDPTIAGACGQFIYTPDVDPIVISDKPNAMFSDNSLLDEICSGSEVDFTDESTDNDPNHRVNTWAWEFGDSGSSTSSNQNPTFTYTDADIGTVDVTLTVSNVLGCTDNYTKSLDVVPGLDDATVATDDTICAGSVVTLDAEPATGGDGTYVYLWEQSTDGSTWQNADGLNDQEDYTTQPSDPSVPTTIRYKRKVTSATCHLFTPVFKVTTSPTSVGGVITPNPVEECYNNNQTTLTLNGQLAEVLEWQSDTNADFSTPTIIPNTTTTLSYLNLTDTTYYRALVKSGVCPSVFSDTAVVNVLPEITGNEFNPTDTLVCAMEDPGTLSPSAPAGGSGNFTFQWQQSIDNTVFGDIAGATSETYNPGGLMQTTYFRREVISDGNCSVLSNVYTVNVIPQPDTTLAVSDPFVCAEDYSLTPNTNIVVSNSETDVTYQAFLVSDDSPQSSLVLGTGSDLDISVVTPITTTNYYIIASPTTMNGAVNSCPVRLQDKATITIVPIPSDALAVSDATICEGQDASITVSASEIDVKYMLKLAGVEKATAQGTGGDIAFTVSPGPSVTSTYEVWAVSTLNNQLCDEVQLVDPAIITVLPLPDNSMAVSDPNVCGQDASFNITVSNTADTVTYTLVEQGGSFVSSLTGTGADLTYTLPTPPSASVYEVWAKADQTSDYGSCDSVLLSDVANVTYAPIPDATLTVSNPQICEGDTASIKISASENNVEYTLTPSGNTVMGNGGDVFFPAVNPTSTTVYTITANSTLVTACADVTLDNTSTVTVIPVPTNKTLTISPDPANVCSGDVFTITIGNTENDVKYTLYENGNPTSNIIFGDGTDKTFTLNPVSDITYSVWATSIYYNSNDEECSTVQMGTDIPVNVDGPISIDVQPIDVQVCSGTTAVFGVTATNASGGAILYQWQTSSDNVTFVDSVGQTSSTLNVNASSPNYYRVIVSSNDCSSITSNSAQVDESAAPISDNLQLSIDDQCLGTDIEVAYTSSLATGEYYRFYYNVTGTNTIVDTSVVLLLNNASGTFNLPADSFLNPGANALIITEIDYAYGQGCSQSGLAVTEVFNIEDIPDTTNINLSANNICLGNDGIVDVSSQLSDNTYQITYDLAGANTVTGSSASLEISAGQGTITIPASELTNIDTTQFIITEIKNSWGQQCPVSGLNINTNIVVEPLPASNIFVDIPNVCSGEDVVANVSGGLSDGDYQVIYNLSGANASSNMGNITLSNGDGTGSFVIPATYVQNTGTTNFELTEISFTTGEGCGVTGLSSQTSFDIDETPNTNGLAIYAPNICYGENATVYFTSNLPDGDYLVHYKVFGDVPMHEEDITLTVNSGAGNSSFTIDASYLPVSGFNTVELTSIANTFGNNCEEIIAISCPLTIEPLPDTTNFAMQVDTVCPVNDARVYITGSMIDGQYLLSYDLSGANSATGIPVYINFINGDGTAEFTIPGNELLNEGLTTITLQSAYFVTGEQCGVTNINISSDFMVESTPDVNNLAISSSNICIGNDNTIELTSTLDDGNYIITYNTENVNYHTDILDTISISSGASSFVVDASNLTNAGTTTIVLTDIKAEGGQQCQGAIATVVSTTFEVEPLPNTATTEFIALDACQGDEVEVYGTSNMDDGSYIVYYHLTGVNVWPSDSAIIDITGGNGNFTYTIPAVAVPNFGASTIWIEGVRANFGESCFVTSSYKSNFTIAKVPDVTNLVAVADSVCLGSFITVDLTSNFDDGTYVFLADITGANPNADVEFTADITAGTGQFVIEANLLQNVGANTITIKKVKNQDGAQCASNVYNTTADFEIVDIPHINNFDIFAENVCLSFDDSVHIESELEDGLYTLTYDITGVNTATDQTTDVNITSGQGSFAIPSSLLTLTGTNECIVTNIKNDASLSCDVDLYKSASFIVIPDPGSTSVSIFADDICINNDAAVEITSVLPDGDILFTYDLIGINDTTNITTTAVFTGGAGNGVFIIPDSLLTEGGVQTVKVTAIDIIGITCSSTGLNIPTNFNIEGALDITSQTFDDAKCEGNEINYQVVGKNNGAGDFFYQWYQLGADGDTVKLNNQGVFDGTTSSDLVISDNTGLENTYYQCAVFTNHCPAILSDSVKLEILTGSDCGDGLENIPDAISPNADGTNDTWVIDGIDNYPNNHIKIFSRWGNLVFETMAYNNESNYFDGTGNTGAGNGKAVADGTYFYFIDLGDGQEVIQGYIVVNR